MSLKQWTLEELKKHRKRPKRALGQNFLINSSVVEQIIAAAKAIGCQQLIEVGPGLGTLTYELVKLEKPIELIELDDELIQKWKSEDFTVHAVDALKWDWDVEPSTLLVSNLPYQISSSLVIERSLDPVSLVGMVLMFQREVAQRITAQPSTKEYGLLSVIAQSAWSIQKVCDVGPGSFYPAPKVSSRVLKFSPLDQRVEPDFLRLVKTAFSHRRKRVRSNLASMLKQIEDLEQIYEQCEIGKNDRAEHLSVHQYQNLFDRTRSR